MSAVVVSNVDVQKYMFCDTRLHYGISDVDISTYIWGDEVISIKIMSAHKGSNDYFENGKSCAFTMTSVFSSEILQVTILVNNYTA